MWITAITYDLAALRQLSDEDIANIVVPILSKKDELKAIDGGGDSTLEYPAPPFSLMEIPLDQTTLVIKRAWNQETSAQAFVDHFNGVSHITAVLEGQV